MTGQNPEFDALRRRLDDELAAGKTVVLGSSELDDPSVRERLPQLLEQLADTHPRQSLSALHLPGYTLLGEIGRGGMSVVHLARHEPLGRTVAVKVTPNWLASDPRSRERLVREARSLALVNHANIVRVYDVIDADGAFAIAMEWVDGQTLARLVRALPTTPTADDMAVVVERLGTPPQQAGLLEANATRTFARMMRDIALAAQAVHDAGLLHLDIKPSNVLVRRDGTPLLADFGVVRELSSEQTHTRTFAGTPIYAAPEQLRRDDAQIGPHTDVYAIGLTLYELLARDQPLRDLDLTSIARTVESGRFPPLSTYVDVPADLANIVQMAIAPEPANRYPSAAALAADLTAFLENRPVVARPLSRTQLLRRWVRSEPWKATLAAALLVLVPVLFGLGGYLAWQWPQLEHLRLEQVRREAANLRHDAFRGLMLAVQASSETAEMLRRAVAIDPSPKTIASHLLFQSYTGQPADKVLQAEYAAQLDDDPALGAIAARMSSGRIFFDDAEAAALAESPRGIDHFVLAMDRVMRARDSMDYEHWRQAEACVQRVSLQGDPDRLIYGLLAMCRAQLDDEPGTRIALQAMHDRWPDTANTLTWAAGLAVAAHRPDADAAVAALVAAVPDDPITASIAIRAQWGKPWHDLRDEANRWLDKGIRCQYVNEMSLRAEGTIWAQPFYLAMAEICPRWASPHCVVTATLLLAPHRATGIVRELLRECRMPHELNQIYDASILAGDKELADETIEQAVALAPDRRLFARQLLEGYARSHETAQGAALARSWRPSRTSLEWAIFQALILATEQDWAGLRDAARHWFDLTDGDQRREAATHLALAESRLGNAESAAEMLGFALAAELRRRNWVDSWLEDAWLRVAPTAPANLRDPERAMRSIGSWRAFGQKFGFGIGGLWADCVLASVYEANGDRNRAQQHVALARRKLRLPKAQQPRGMPARSLIEEQLALLEGRLR